MDYLQYYGHEGPGTQKINHVLNLIINGLPSIFDRDFQNLVVRYVLNLIINGLPSILKSGM